MFKRKLKNTIKNELMRDEREYESLEELIKIVIDLDDKLYKRVMKKRFDNESREKTIVSIQQSYYKAMPMKLDLIERKKKNLRNKQDKINKTCYSSTESAESASKKEYYHVKNFTVLQQALNETASDDASASTQKINTIIREQQQDFDNEFE
ncbi:MAG: hypothetical protein Q9191_008196 [Dirinaria sp. TL-2023a]